MKKIIAFLLSLASFTYLVPSAWAVPMFLANDQVYMNEKVGDDTYVAGGMVVIDSDVTGDLYVAGGDVTVNGNVQGDVVAAGGNITLRGNVDDDVRMAGGNLRVMGNVGDDLFLAGGNVTVDKAAQIGGSVSLGNGFSYFQGTVGENMYGSVGSMIFGGTVKGNVQLETEEKIQVLSTASVLGDFKYSSTEEPTFDTSFVKGNFDYQKVSESQLAEKSRQWLWSALIAGAIFSLLSSFVVGLLYIFLAPNLLNRIAKKVYEKPFPSLGYGFVTFVAVFALMLVAFMTLIGFKLGLLMLLALGAFFLVIGALNGYFMGYIWTRGKESGKGKTILLFLTGLLLCELIAFIPVLGWIFLLVLSLMNLGAAYSARKELYLKLRKSKDL